MSEDDIDEQPETDAEDGDSPRVFRPRRALPTDVVRPTRAEVNLSHLRHNLHLLRRTTQVPIWGVLKADAYGHGAKAVGRTLERAGMDGICVALVEEGVELREAGLTCPILVMGGYYGDAYRELSHFGLTPVLVDRGQVEALGKAAKAAGVRTSVHVKLDTGMGRLGVREDEWPTFANAIGSASALELGGVMTHFACADDPNPAAVAEPLEAFARGIRQLARCGLPSAPTHAAGSAAMLRSRETHLSLVRPGIALFGVDPLPRSVPRLVTPGDIGQLKPVMSVHSRIVALRRLRPGDAVGYGGTFRATRASVVGTIPIGYADGLDRALSNRGAVLVRGMRAPILGVVSMDMTTIDVTDVPGAEIGDDVVLLGSQRYGERTGTITAEEIAEWMGSIAWEALTNISRRVPRFYRQP
jgi:alanine racemase